MNKECHCCLCNKQADYLVECKTFVEHRCISIEHKLYCSDHYIHHRKEERHKQLNSKDSINTERLKYLLGRMGDKASWNDF